MTQNTGKLTLFTQYSYLEIRTVDDNLVAEVPPGNQTDAKRLVACWNACEGLSTKAIETQLGVFGVTRDMAVAYDRTQSQIEALQASYREAAAAAQRLQLQLDTLLSAAQLALDTCCDLIATPAGEALASAITNATRSAA